MTSRSRGLLAVLAVCLAAVTCSSPTAPRVVIAELSSMLLYPHALQTQRLLRVTAAPKDTSFRLAPNQRLRARVMTSAGDDEEVLFAPQLCDGDYLCHSLVVGMQEGHDVRSLDPFVASLPARFHLSVVVAQSGDTVHVSTRFATISVYDPADVPAVSRDVRRRPGVAYVERNGVGWIGPPIRWRVLALRPADRTPIVPGDGAIQYRSGDTITVRYVQPDGSILEASAVAP